MLSRVPILGPLLFGNVNNDDERTELIVLLRPRVVRTGRRCAGGDPGPARQAAVAPRPAAGQPYAVSTGAAGRGREAGYAVIAAMVCAAAFALAAAQLTVTSRNAVTTASAEAARARLEADAQAGLAIALDGLQDPDPQARWTLGGEPRTFDFDDAELIVAVEDERGKIPLNTITPSQARAMFQLGGAEAASVDGLVAALLLRRDLDAGGVAQESGATSPSAGRDDDPGSRPHGRARPAAPARHDTAALRRAGAVGEP